MTHETGRVEAFSDGVFAIAITLLILNIHAPALDIVATNGDLLAAVVDQWASFLAFFLSFITILVMWINHHNLFTFIKRGDQILLLLNGMLLLGVTFLPFPTILLAEHIERPSANTAAVIYGGTAFLIGVFYNLMWRYAIQQQRLLDKNVNLEAVHAVSVQYNAGLTAYAIATLIAAFNATASVAIYLLLILFFALRSARPAILISA